jgi:hypothetical protein
LLGVVRAVAKAFLIIKLAEALAAREVIALERHH